MIKLSKEGAYLLYGNKIVEETEELLKAFLWRTDESQLDAVAHILRHIF